MKMKCVATGKHCFFTIGKTYGAEPGGYDDSIRRQWVHVCQDDMVSDLEGEDRWVAVPMRGHKNRFEIPGNNTILEIVE